jgi:hypothetical protein
MKGINKNNLLLLDFWFVVGIIVFDFVFIGIPKNFIPVYISYVFKYINILFIIICFAKSIAGIILLIKSIIKKDNYVTENILELLFFFILFILLSILILILYIFLYVNYLPNTNEDPIFLFSIQIGLIYLIRFGIINTLINIFGIPLWFSWYMYSNKSINDEMKRAINIITQIMIISTNGWIFIILFFSVD